MLLKICLKALPSVGLIVLFFCGTFAYSQTSINGTLKENNLQTEFCATHAACAISVGIMEGVNQGTAATERIKNFFTNRGRQPAKTEAEFKEWLASQSPSERQALVKRCTDSKGSYMLDWCQESFLTPSEFEASRPKVKVESDDSLRFGANLKIKELQRQDDEIMKVLLVSCRMESTGPNYGCTSQSDQIHFLYTSELLFNQDFDNKRLGFKFESNSAKFYAQFFDWDPRKEQWVAKQMPSQDDSWENLPQRASGNSPFDKQLASAVNSSTTRSGSNPFEGTSADLNPSAIEAQRERYHRNQDLLLGLTAQVMTTTARAMEQANQERQQQQRDAQQRAEAVANNQRIYSDDPAKAYIPPSPPGQRIYSDSYSSPSQTNSNNFSPANTSRERGTAPTAMQCISATRPAGKNWAVLTNTCSFAIEASWCYMGGDCKYGNWGTSGSSTIRAGGNISASTSLDKAARYDVFFIACQGANALHKETNATTFYCN